MPNKSDSAGKLHQYYTCKALKEIFPDAIINSPLDNSDLRNENENEFIDSELQSLKIIGFKSAKAIKKDIESNILEVKDVGSFSGANQHDTTDDILVYTNNGQEIAYSLKSKKGSLRNIFSKNMGANSLIKKYFNSDKNQKSFTNYLVTERIKFLNNILDTDFKKLKDATKNIRQHSFVNGYSKPRFSYYSDANEHRRIFLKSLRDKLFKILLKKTEVKNIIRGCNLILDSGKNHILANYKRNSEEVELKVIKVQTLKDYKNIEKSGNDSVKVLLNNYEIRFRYKFESDILSSIKLAGDYHQLK